MDLFFMTAPDPQARGMCMTALDDEDLKIKYTRLSVARKSGYRKAAGLR